MMILTQVSFNKFSIFLMDYICPLHFTEFRIEIIINVYCYWSSICSIDMETELQIDYYNLNVDTRAAGSVGDVSSSSTKNSESLGKQEWALYFVHGSSCR